MLDLAWSEIALIAVVAVVVIGPKDLPDAIRSVAKGVQKLRRMASEFQSHADELVREAKLEDVRDQIRDIRNFDIKSTIERNLDQDGEIRRTFNDDPLKDAWKPAAPSPEPGAIRAGAPEGTAESPASPDGGQDGGPASAPASALAAPPAAEPPRPAGPPAFVPPSIAAGAGPDTHSGPSRPAESNPTMSPNPSASAASDAAKPNPSV
ncbi:twin-arginine translocase subunit TatB [Pseudoroseomonas rhizosphaerae]|uniref:Sec-independent protein translocase protein TatB n=1 Tax=Teichococcus rhizosphaerae TaxID=1335062 RepID=A0A2C7AHA6_9PROT|nr:Sec-independent protein translocase protein TatB [Pseudoroseomonas rhizosphaerae]PHK96596.1 twin-arginine translocase subunit TatB [Pseudoroseomonas rhizosphaerae]